MGFIYDQVKGLEKNVVQTQLQNQRNINERLDNLSFKVLTYSAYSSLTPKDNNTLYLVDNNGDYSIYKGSTQISGTGGGTINVKYGMRLYDYEFAPPKHISSSQSATSREGSEYAGGHDTLCTATTASMVSYELKDGGTNSRFIPTTTNSPNRFVIGSPVGSIADGRSKLELRLQRYNGSTYITETMLYELVTTSCRVDFEEVGLLTARSSYSKYGLRCTRTAGGSTTTWFIPDLDIYPAADMQGFATPTVNNENSTIDNISRMRFPTLTAGYLASRIQYLQFQQNHSYYAPPYLVLEIGDESLYNGRVQESGSLYKIVESANCPLGITRDESGNEFQYKPQIYALTSYYTSVMRCAKIAAYTRTKDVT